MSEVFSESTAVLAGRGSVYAILARGFSQPDGSVVQFLRACSDTDLKDDTELSKCVGALLKSFGRASLPELQDAYMRLFDPVNGPFPYETEYKKAHEFSKAQILSDIMGFYRAFGVEPRGDRPDQMAAELEFMHLLARKESHAAGRGELENASLCREAAGKFFHEHLATWTDELLEAIRAGFDKRGESPHPFYVHLMDLLQRFIAGEKEVLT